MLKKFHIGFADLLIFASIFYNRTYKQVLCPYWQRTEYGTVRCDFLGREFIDDEDAGAIEKIINHFKSAEAK